MLGTAKGKMLFGGVLALLGLAFYAMTVSTSLEQRGPQLSNSLTGGVGAPNHRELKEAMRRLPRAPRADSLFYTLHERDSFGNVVDFNQFKGKVVLVVNVASHDLKHTDSNYRQLQDLYRKYSKHGLRVLAFPCNQFGGEEAGSDAEIRHYVQKKFGVTFTIMQKTDVNGKNAAAIWNLLKASFPGEVRWNFSAKFLIDKGGQVRFRKRMPPASLEDEIVQLLQLT